MKSFQCIDCKHYLVGYGACAAFQEVDSIPAEILSGEFDHSKPFPGDRGIRYEPTEAVAAIDAATN